VRVCDIYLLRLSGSYTCRYDDKVRFLNEWNIGRVLVYFVKHFVGCSRL